tara:strand:- start:3768 stop:4112 length:345 start_codon:yes stop_codon:yes gene_type:complete
MSIVNSKLRIEHIEGGDWKTISNIYVYASIESFVILSGFTTDLASKPSKSKNEVVAAVVHDYIYRNNLPGWTRKEADQLFLDIMKEDGVSFYSRYKYYWAVRAFGWKAWKDNRK